MYGVVAAVLINLSEKSSYIRFSRTDDAADFCTVFIIAGTELDVAVFRQGVVIYLGVLYLAVQFLGKMVGGIAASVITNVPKNICTCLGFCLFPQAGVLIGLALCVQTSQVTKHAAPEVLELFVLIVILCSLAFLLMN